MNSSRSRSTNKRRDPCAQARSAPMPTPIPSRVSIVSRRPEAEEIDEGEILRRIRVLYVKSARSKAAIEAKKH